MQSVDYILISLVEDLDLQTKFETFRLKTSKQHVLLYGRGFVKAYSYLYFSEITYVIHNEQTAFNTAYERQTLTYIFTQIKSTKPSNNTWRCFQYQLIEKLSLMKKHLSFALIFKYPQTIQIYIYIHMCVLFNFQMKKLLAMSQKEPLKVKVR